MGRYLDSLSDGAAAVVTDNAFTGLHHSWHFRPTHKASRTASHSTRGEDRQQEQPSEPLYTLCSLLLVWRLIRFYLHLPAIPCHLPHSRVNPISAAMQSI